MTHIVKDTACRHFIGTFQVSNDDYCATLRAFYSSSSKDDNSTLPVEAERFAWNYWPRYLKLNPGEHSTAELKKQWNDLFLPDKD